VKNEMIEQIELALGRKNYQQAERKYKLRELRARILHWLDLSRQKMVNMNED
jgi:hypothetical protein